MNPPEPPNPERRSTNAMITGLGLVALSWFLGVGSVFAAAFTGGLAGVAVGLIGGVVLMLAACLGALLMFIGVIWIALRVIADQTGDEARQRYKNVQR